MESAATNPGPVRAAGGDPPGRQQLLVSGCHLQLQSVAPYTCILQLVIYFSAKITVGLEAYLPICLKNKNRKNHTQRENTQRA